MFARINDPASCKAWLASLTPVDTEANLFAINEFLLELLSGSDHATLTAQHKLPILDTVRSSIQSLLQDRLHEAEMRSVLLSLEEGTSLWRLLDLAGVLRDAYAELIASLPILSEYDVAATDRKPGNVDALHRALDLNALILLLHQRTRVMVPTILWDQHCQLGKLVRAFHCQDHEIADIDRLALTNSCRKAFVMPVLLALADPATLNTSEFAMTVLATRLWSGKVAFRIDPAGNITLTARPEAKPGPCVFLGDYRVRFDSQSLVRSVDRALQALGDGRMPKEWVKESQGNIGASKILLKTLKRQWGVVEPESINYPVHAWGKPGRPNVKAVLGFHLDSRSERRNLAATDPRGLVKPTYDYQRLREDRLSISPQDLDHTRLLALLEGAESWNLAGETLDSLLCARRQQRPNLYHRQLVGIQYGAREDWTTYRLGWVQGLQQGISEDQHGQLRPSQTQMVRVRLFAGRARLLRTTIDAQAVSAYLLLPTEMDGMALEEESLLEKIQSAPAGFSLILPVASFRPERDVRVMVADHIIELQLAELFARGLDFDRVSFKLRA